jgi:hypothetical protein
MQIGGVPNGELNTLELEFLFLTNFELHVKRDTYDGYRNELLAWNAGKYQSVQTKSLVSEVLSLQAGAEAVMPLLSPHLPTHIEEAEEADDAMAVG